MLLEVGFPAYFALGRRRAECRIDGLSVGFWDNWAVGLQGPIMETGLCPDMEF